MTRALAGAVLLVGALALGPEQTSTGWEMLAGAMIGLGFVILLIGVIDDD